MIADLVILRASPVLVNSRLEFRHRAADVGRFAFVSDDVARTALLDLVVDPGPITTISLTGDLDPATAPLLDDALGTIVADEAVGRVVLDLAGLSFLDSSGLRSFVTAREALSGRGADLALRRPSANIRRLLDITGLGEVIDVE
ncbi:MAG: rsbV2 [Acidimicrobiales bacterium]|nr:rsbV2 [Acidimicrobiales bacterium]